MSELVIITADLWSEILWVRLSRPVRFIITDEVFRSFLQKHFNEKIEQLTGSFHVLSMS
jgi:hypothetical protein